VEEGKIKAPLNTSSQIWWPDNKDVANPRLFLHEFLKPREDIKESLQAKRVFEYQCNSTVHAPRSFVPITIAHPSFTSWWQEFHDHTFNVPVHSLCLELMPEFQPISEVTNLSFLFFQ
jgi:hypothetical protein